MILSYKLFHHFHDNGCISITMFLDCALNYGFHFFFQFCCLMTPLRYLGVGSGAGAGAGARVGAGTGTGAGAGTRVEVEAYKYTCMKTVLALFGVFGLIHVT